MINKVTAEEVAATIKPGIIYITKGTSQQVVSLLPEHVVVRRHFNPTTTVFRRWLIPNPMEDDIIANIIFYPELKGTGRVKETRTTKAGRYGSVKSDGAYNLPNDQTVELPKNVYFFVLLKNPITGEITKTNDKANLEGDFIQELDLRHVVFNEESDLANELPLTAKSRALVTDPLVKELHADDLVVEEGSEWFFESNKHISQLTKDSAVRAWYELGKSGEYFKMFLVERGLYKQPDKKMPLILIGARAWCLHPYLAMFLDKIKENRQTAPVQLARFASWVYLTSKVYTNPGAPGLYWYEATRSDRQGYWVFKPSRIAKLQLPYFLDES